MSHTNAAMAARVARVPHSRPHPLRGLVLVLLAAGILLTGCRAVATAVVYGVAAGFVIAATRHNPPPRHTHHTDNGWYYYHDSWHRERPHPVRVRTYYHNGRWYESRRHDEPSYHGRSHNQSGHRH